jgi:hypothetical protein
VILSLAICVLLPMESILIKLITALQMIMIIVFRITASYVISLDNNNGATLIFTLKVA